MRIALELGISVASTDHLRGKDNFVCDGMSRGVPAEELGLPPELMIDLDNDLLAQRALILCNPAFDSTTPEGLQYLWVKAGLLATDFRAAALADP